MLVKFAELLPKFELVQIFAESTQKWKRKTPPKIAMIVISSLFLISTLQMLTNIENRIEELFQMIEMMPQDKVEAAQKVRVP